MQNQPNKLRPKWTRPEQMNKKKISLYLFMISKYTQNKYSWRSICPVKPKQLSQIVQIQNLACFSGVDLFLVNVHRSIYCRFAVCNSISYRYFVWKHIMYYAHKKMVHFVCDYLIEVAWAT